MLHGIYGIPIEYAATFMAGAIGIGLKMTISSIYRRDIKNTRDIENTSKKKKWIKKLIENYHDLFTNDKSRNTSLFTSEGLERRTFACIRLKKLDMLINQMPFFIITMICGFTYYEIYWKKSYSEILLFTSFGITVVMGLFTACRLMSNNEKKEIIHLQITNYLENKLLPIILETKFGEERRLTSREGYPLGGKEGYTPAAGEIHPFADKELAAGREGYTPGGKEAYSFSDRELSDGKDYAVAGNPAAAENQVPAGEHAADISYETDVEQTAPHRSLNQTLAEAYPERKITEEEKRIIEEVLKEYLFK